MKKGLSLLFTLALCVSFVACGNNAKTISSSDDYVGANFESVIVELKKAGFNNIETSVIDDLTSSSEMKDGTIEKIVINEDATFAAKTSYPNDAKVLITYHIVKKLQAPISSDNIQNDDYLSISNLFKSIGFTNIKTKEVYDLDPDEMKTDNVNEVIINGKNIFTEADEFPFDANVSVVCHLPYEKFTVKMHIDFIPNLIFSKYDVDLLLNGNKQYTLPHGNDADYEFRLKEGEHTFIFTNSTSSSVRGETLIDVTSDVEASFKIYCHSDKINVEEVFVDYKNELSDDEAKIMCTEYGFLGTNYKDAINDLEKLGFTNIAKVPVYDVIWGITDVESTSDVTIGGNDDFKRGNVFKKDVEIVVTYHMNYDDDPSRRETGSTPTEIENPGVSKSESVYDFAFLRKFSEYSIYYLFDMESNIVRYFATNDTGILVGTFTGNLNNGITITYDYDSELWSETFKYKSSGNTTNAVLIDVDGFEWDFEKSDVSTAEAAMNAPGFFDMNPLENDPTVGGEPTTHTETSESTNVTNPLTVNNSEDLRDLVNYDMQTDEINIRTYANINKGSVIEIELITAFVEKYQNYTTRFNYLLFAVNGEHVMMEGPAFMFENVAYYDLKLIGSNIPDTFGLGIHCRVLAEIEGYENGMILLNPVSIEVIKIY